jgi:integrative and conjugative element protein (TIGR02256 family)
VHIEHKVFTVWIGRSLLEFIESEAVKWSTLETGGVFAGYCVRDEIVVTQVVGPGPNAMHKATMFIPDYQFHNREIARIFKESNGREYYLGDWHTHPNSTAYLSGMDKETLEEIGNYKRNRIFKPIMLVMATNPINVGVWIYHRHSIEKASLMKY